MLAQVITASLILGAPATTDQRERDDTHRLSKRMQFLSDSLQTALPLDKPIESPLKEVIDYLEDVASPPESARDPSLRVKIIANDAAFKAVKGENYKVEDETIRLPRLTGTPLRTVLRKVCEQLDAVVVLRDYAFELTTFREEFGRDRLPGESPILVYRAVVRESAAEVLAGLGVLHQRTVAVSERAAARASEPVTVRLVNLPFDSAVNTLAEAAGLRAVCNGKAVLVTTPAHAEELVTAAKGKFLPGVWEPLPRPRVKPAQPRP